MKTTASPPKSAGNIRSNAGSKTGDSSIGVSGTISITPKIIIIVVTILETAIAIVEITSPSSLLGFTSARSIASTAQGSLRLEILPVTNERYIPYCIEPSLGADRVALAFLVEAYDEEEISEGDVRTVLRLHPYLAPIKAAILPLSKKLGENAEKLFEDLSKKFPVEYDDSGSIGKRYRRQDEIGTPFCITYDFDSLEDNSVTIRDRDTMEQQRVKIDEVADYILKRIEF